jgi:hypothetical protein
MPAVASQHARPTDDLTSHHRFPFVLQGLRRSESSYGCVRLRVPTVSYVLITFCDHSLVNRHLDMMTKEDVFGMMDFS